METRLIWVVPGGLVSDIPGWALFGGGVVAEVVLTAAYLLQRRR
jgi:hypothetical protein